MSKRLLNRLFSNIEANQYDLDDPRTTLLRRDIILSKPFLKKVYEEWYVLIKERLSDIPEGDVLEIGSGGGFFKDVFPNVITSDIMTLSCCDRCIDALDLPFDNESLSAITMVNVFHHLPDCARFLSEAQRTLKDGGKLVMVEPSNSFWSRLIYKNLHHEPFITETIAWTIESSGPLSGANSALPWKVFQRDIELVKTNYPQLQIKTLSYQFPFSYLLSGGVSMKALSPSVAYPLIRMFEKILTNRHFNMFYLIEVEKNTLLKP